MIQVNRIYLIFNPVHFLVDSSVLWYIMVYKIDARSFNNYNIAVMPDYC